jgi:hypothetical protein
VKAPNRWLPPGLAQNGNSQFPIEDRLLAGKLLSLNGFFHANDGVCND